MELEKLQAQLKSQIQEHQVFWEVFRVGLSVRLLSC